MEDYVEVFGELNWSEPLMNLAGEAAWNIA